MAASIQPRASKGFTSRFKVAATLASVAANTTEPHDITCKHRGDVHSGVIAWSVAALTSGLSISGARVKDKSTITIFLCNGTGAPIVHGAASLEFIIL